MTRLTTSAVLTAGCIVLGGWAIAASTPKADKPLAHIVIFALKEHTSEAREACVKSCHKYLSDHEGTLYYSVGTRAGDVDEPGVSDHDFDVALHLVFENKEAKLKYIKDPRHVKFVEENLATFGKVRVFDSYLSKP